MESIRRWWGRYSLQTALVTSGLVISWVMRQTNGVALMETYQFFSRPFQALHSSQELLSDAQTRELRYRLTELEAQNQNLQKLLGAKPNYSDAGSWAMVIGRSADSWWNQVIIAKGSSDGIQKGAIAVGPGGLVGRVTDVSPHSSRVLLISDPSSQVGVVVSRSRYMGMLRGQTQTTASLEFFERDPDVKPGDIVLTSQFSTLFPAGIPVGRVMSVNLDKQPAPEATVEFSVPIGLLEFVKVYPFTEHK
ncbi:rod shape-determining protein MreC [Tumidithrix elongata RA019]|uniref:Cell shape-determining protein MreC n=1 Tax=Tumidithrix elongata BACA0141 TaxID=2716417 RepID=A0AAW9PUA1_9CYAN|nr:rod shape-determining protein MreC [Tumidithrix elongata RA019]